VGKEGWRREKPHIAGLVVGVTPVEADVQHLIEFSHPNRKQAANRVQNVRKVRTEHPTVNGVQVVGRHLEVRGVSSPNFPSKNHGCNPMEQSVHQNLK
jgi:hypothetical protein